MAKLLKWLINTIAFLIFISTLVIAVETGNWWWFVACVIVTGVYFSWKSWGSLIMGMKNIETSIWGKPLDRDMWDKGEMNDHKVKIVYKGEPIMKKVPLENKHLATLFFWLFIVFFGFFVWNRYTFNVIFAMIMLQFSLAFKTWAIVREQNGN